LRISGEGFSDSNKGLRGLKTASARMWHQSRRREQHDAETDTFNGWAVAALSLAILGLRIMPGPERRCNFGAHEPAQAAEERSKEFLIRLEIPNFRIFAIDDTVCSGAGGKTLHQLDQSDGTAFRRQTEHDPAEPVRNHDERVTHTKESTQTYSSLQQGYKKSDRMSLYCMNKSGSLTFFNGQCSKRSTSTFFHLSHKSVLVSRYIVIHD
jgi:hypothetical protein